MELLFGMPGESKWVIFLFGFLIILILSLLALIDMLRHNFKGQNDKLIWVVIVLGTVLYFVIGRQPKSSIIIIQV